MHVLKPYSAWVEAGAIYRSIDTAQNLSAIQDLIWYSINILAADEATLLSPRKMEEFLCDLTFWGTFRSKEIWLDAVDIVTKHCDKFSVDGGTLQSMHKEALVVGEPGLGSRAKPLPKSLPSIKGSRNQGISSLDPAGSNGGGDGGDGSGHCGDDEDGDGDWFLK